MPNSRRHILLFEDHRDVRTAFLAFFGALHDYVIDPAGSTREALGLSKRLSIDAAVIDLGFGADTPARLALVREWRTAGLQFPTIVTSPSDYDGLSVEVLDAGADDFLRKPYQFTELRARIQRRMERHLATNAARSRVDGVLLPTEPFEFAGAIITPDLTIKFPGGRVSRLTAKQIGMLREFSAHAGSLVLKDQLIYAVWGADANLNSASVHQYLHVLRKLYREGGLDLDAFVTAENKAGWRIAEANFREPVLSIKS